MKKAYEDMARFVRWVVVGAMASIVALPALLSVGAAN
jgi:hypothetical protein